MPCLAYYTPHGSRAAQRSRISRISSPFILARQGFFLYNFLWYFLLSAFFYTVSPRSPPPALCIRHIWRIGRWLSLLLLLNERIIVAKRFAGGEVVRIHDLKPLTKLFERYVPAHTICITGVRWIHLELGMSAASVSSAAFFFCLRMLYAVSALLHCSLSSLNNANSFSI